MWVKPGLWAYLFILKQHEFSAALFRGKSPLESGSWIPKKQQLTQVMLFGTAKLLGTL